MPSLAYSARAPCAICAMPMDSPAEAAANAARNVIWRMLPPVRSMRRASWRKSASVRTCDSSRQTLAPDRFSRLDVGAREIHYKAQAAKECGVQVLTEIGG